MVLVQQIVFLSKPVTLCIPSRWAHTCLLAKPNRSWLPRLGYEVEVCQAQSFHKCHSLARRLPQPSDVCLVQDAMQAAYHRQHVVSNTQSWPCSSPTSNPALAAIALQRRSNFIGLPTNLYYHLQPLPSATTIGYLFYICIIFSLQARELIVEFRNHPHTMVKTAYGEEREEQDLRGSAT